MQQNTCPHCGKSLKEMAGAAFCPYCGGAVEARDANADQPQAVREILRQAEELKDPRKRWELLQKADAEHPDNLAICQELLFLGRLYDRGSKVLDFSVIKCHLMMLYLKPENFNATTQAQMRDELFEHPLLQKCQRLSGDADAFLRMYLLRLAGEFIQLFLRGDSVYMRRVLGFGMESRAPKLLASPVCMMMENIRQDGELSGQRRDMLLKTLYQAFSKDMVGDTQWLDAQLRKAGVSVPGMG